MRSEYLRADLGVGVRRGNVVDIDVRAEKQTAEFATWVGNDAILLILEARLKELSAEELAGEDDAACYENLLEVCYLHDLLETYIDAKIEVTREANRGEE
jgi:hypothetical protein